MPTEREMRAALRRSWPGGLRASHDPAQLETAEARLHSMWQLAVDAWASAGRPLPDYPRTQIPGRLIRPDE